MRTQIFYALFILLPYFFSYPAFAINVSKLADIDHKSSKMGKFHAVLIGIEKYKDARIPALSTPKKNLNALSKILKDKYGFKTTVLLNQDATQKKILSVISKTAKNITSKDSLIIYFSGHGKQEEFYDTAWWIPFDATVGQLDSYIDNKEVKKIIQSSKAGHILVLSDSSFSKNLLNKPKQYSSRYTNPMYIKLVNKNSRLCLTSGNKRPKKSGKSRGLSLFTHEIIQQLKSSNKKIISAHEIYLKINKTIKANAQYTPLYRSFKDSNDQDGSFLFIAKGQTRTAQHLKASATSPIAAPSPTPLSNLQKKDKFRTSISVDSNIEGAMASVDGLKVGVTPVSGITVKPGDHEVRIEKEGYIPYHTHIYIRQGDDFPLSIHLEKEKPKTGQLTVITEPPGSTVTLLNNDQLYSPGMTLLAGTYQIQVTKKGYTPKNEEVNLKIGAHENLTIKLSLLEKLQNSLGMQLRRIKKGTFLMGSPDTESRRGTDETQHKVTLTKSYYLQQAEVTIGQWKKFVQATQYKTEAEKKGGAKVWAGFKWIQDSEYNWKNPGFPQTDDHPVTCISWNDAQAFIQWLSRTENRKYRLPSEAEWEYACRANTKSYFSFGNCLDIDQGNFSANSKWQNCPTGESAKGTIPTNQLKANAFGLKHMHGNVMEWCQDWYGPYSNTAAENPIGPSSGKSRVLRGGAWESYAHQCRSANRFKYPPSERYSTFGFRVLLEIE